MLYISKTEFCLYFVSAKWGVFNLVRVSNATTSCFLSDENDDHFKIIVIVIAKLHFWSLELQILTQGA